MTDFAATDHFLEDRLDASLAELSRLVAQPSVAAQGLGMEACAALVAGMFEARDVEEERLVEAELFGSECARLAIFPG